MLGSLILFLLLLLLLLSWSRSVVIVEFNSWFSGLDRGIFFRGFLCATGGDFPKPWVVVEHLDYFPTQQFGPDLVGSRVDLPLELEGLVHRGRGEAELQELDVVLLVIVEHAAARQRR